MPLLSSQKHLNWKGMTFSNFSSDVVQTLRGEATSYFKDEHFLLQDLELGLHSSQSISKSILYP